MALKGLSWVAGVVGTALFVLGLIISHSTREVASQVLVEDTFSEGMSLISFTSGMPDEVDAFGEVAELEFSPVTAVVGSASAKTEVGFFPPVRFEGRYLYLKDMGFAIKIKARERKTGAEFSGVIPLRVLPPGRESRVQILGADLLVSLAPSGEVLKDRLRGRRYDLVEPAFRLRTPGGGGGGGAKATAVQKEEAKVKPKKVKESKKARGKKRSNKGAKKAAKPKEPKAAETKVEPYLVSGGSLTISGVDITLEDTPYWVEAVSVKDGGLLNTILGLALTAVAIIMRVLAWVAALFKS